MIKFRMIPNTVICGGCPELVKSCMLLSVSEQAPGPKESEGIVERNDFKREVLD